MALGSQMRLSKRMAVKAVFTKPGRSQDVEAGVLEAGGMDRVSRLHL